MASANIPNLGEISCFFSSDKHSRNDIDFNLSSQSASMIGMAKMAFPSLSVKVTDIYFGHEKDF